MMHSLKNVMVIDCQDDVEFYAEGNYLEEMFDKVFLNLNDSDGIPLKGRAKYKNNFNDILEKCNIENSIDLVYKLLNKHVSKQDDGYYVDNDESVPSPDVLKVLEFLSHLHDKKIPKRFVGGFLILMVKFVYFPLINV